MTTIITYGTFDLFHVGHVRLLSRARALGTRLFVGVSTDRFNENKKKTSINSFEERCEVVSSCSHVDQVFPEEDWDQKVSDIINFNASVFVIGDDWKGKFDYLIPYCDVVYLPRTVGISTSIIKDDIRLEKNYKRQIDLSGFKSNSKIEKYTDLNA